MGVIRLLYIASDVALLIYIHTCALVSELINSNNMDICNCFKIPVFV